MSKKIFFGIGIIVVCTAIIGTVVLMREATSQPKDNRVSVAATTPALCDIVRHVAGDDVNVRCILPAGASPHYFEFTPKSLADLQGTKIVFAIGHGVDDWVQDVSRAVNGATIIVVDENIQLKTLTNKDEIAEHGPIDPHYWLHPVNARVIANTVKRLLTNVDPANTLGYMNRTKAFQSTLIAKEREWLEIFSKLESKNIFTLHDAWAYFADAFHLTIVGSYEPAAGEEPTPRDLANMRAVLQQKKVKVIFSEPQKSSEKMQTFAKDLGIGIAELDPIEGTGDRADYIAIMDANVRAIEKAFSSKKNEASSN